MDWTYDDGGRAGAGFRGHTGDCGVRAAAIAAQLPYREVYDAINELARLERPRKGSKRSNARTGIQVPTFRRYVEGELGFVWTPTMRIGSGTMVHLRADELAAGRLIVRLSRHYAAVVDGVVHDTYDPTRDGSRCVYGYWSKA